MQVHHVGQARLVVFGLGRGGPDVGDQGGQQRALGAVPERILAGAVLAAGGVHDDALGKLRDGGLRGLLVHVPQRVEAVAVAKVHEVEHADGDAALGQDGLSLGPDFALRVGRRCGALQRRDVRHDVAPRLARARAADHGHVVVPLGLVAVHAHGDALRELNPAGRLLVHVLGELLRRGPSGAALLLAGARRLPRREVVEHHQQHGDGAHGGGRQVGLMRGEGQRVRLDELHELPDVVLRRAPLRQQRAHELAGPVANPCRDSGTDQHPDDLALGELLHGGLVLLLGDQRERLPRSSTSSSCGAAGRLASRAASPPRVLSGAP